MKDCAKECQTCGSRFEQELFLYGEICCPICMSSDVILYDDEFNEEDGSLLTEESTLLENKGGFSRTLK